MNRHSTIASLIAMGVITAAASLASSTVATAGEPSGDRLQTRVYYDRRDLTTERGLRSIYRRIMNAAEEVCPGSDSRNLGEVAASRECERHAIARAIGQIGDRRLASLDAQVAAHRG